MKKKKTPKNKRFWRITNEADGSGVLRLEGVIAEETWYGDEVTPKLFKQDLAAIGGDLTVWINSPGGDVFAAAEIYAMLKEHPYNVTIKIDGIAASAASVIAMAGDEVLMSPLAMMMCHNPITIAFGNTAELEKSIAMLDEVKESIINAYEAKTGLDRKQISKLMDNETWFSAKKALELGFADGILYGEYDADNTPQNSFIWDRTSVKNCLSAKLSEVLSDRKNEPEAQKNDAVCKSGTDINQLEKRLNLLKPTGGFKRI